MKKAISFIKLFLLLIIGIILYHFIFSRIFLFSKNFLGKYYLYNITLAQTILGLICIILVLFINKVFDLSLDLHWKNNIFVDNYFLGLIIPIYIIDIYSSFFHRSCKINSLATISLSILLHFSIALTEELILRVLLINIFSHKYSLNQTTTILFSAFFFGIFHINDFQNLPQEFAQAFLAFFVGIYLAILYQKTNTIWCTVIIHALLNYKLGISQYIIVHNSIDKTFPLRTIIGIALIFLYLEILLYIICFFNNKAKKIYKYIDILLYYLSFPLTFLGLSYGISKLIINKSTDCTIKKKRISTLCSFLSIIAFSLIVIKLSTMTYIEKNSILNSLFLNIQ